VVAPRANPLIPAKLREIEDQLEDLRLATQSGETIRKKTSVLAEGLKSLRRQTPGTLDINRYRTARGFVEDHDYVGPQHDLTEVAKALDTESFFARAVQRHRELILKNGWRIIGRDPERVKYVKRRLWEIAMTTEVTVDAMFREIITNLVAFSNHFIVQKRDEARSSGSRYKWKGRKMLPLSGLYNADPTTLSVKQTTTGLPVKWRQRVHNISGMGFSSVPGRRDRKNEKFYDYRDVIHLTLDKRTGWIFGTPYIIPVLDDIRLMRRLEELMDIIAHKHAFPLFIAKVGSEQAPATDVERDGVTYSEVSLFRSQIEDMEFEGGLVTTERHSLEMIGAEGKALDLGPYLKHIEQRVIGGIRLSEIDLGRGGSANRNTAQTITQTLIDACTEIQRTVEDAINWKLIFFLLMEGGFNIRGEALDDDMVYLDFPPIDTEERRSQENHEMALYQGHLTTEDQARRRCGMDPIQDEERANMYLEVQEIPLIEAKAEADAAVAKAKAAAAPTAQENSTANKNRPQNQRGTSPSKPKVAKDRLVDEYLEATMTRWWGEEPIDQDSHELWTIYVAGYKDAHDVEKIPVAGYSKFRHAFAVLTLKDAHSRGMTMVDTSESDAPSLGQIRAETAATVVAGSVRRTGISAYAAGFAQGAEDAGHIGIMRTDTKQAITFPVKPRDVVSPVESLCPDLEVLEA
jgi:hypothetical protein